MDPIVKGVKANRKTYLIKYDCGHEVEKGNHVSQTKLCPKCRKKLFVSRERFKRSLPYYLKTEI